ncbi:MAG: hypothetical protein JNK77_20750 [Saprospiraceae bacterium]|nr:hypothetical protein [Saprospiraceae bacterium]
MKNTLFVVFLLAVLTGMLIISCERDPVYYGDLYGEPLDTTGNPVDTMVLTHPCDPDTVYFEQDLLPILRSNCALSGCHDVQSHREGVIYTTYQYTRTTGKVSTTNPTNSKMYKSLIDTDPEDRMPPAPQQPLTQAQISMILRWMQQGALDLHCDAACDTTNFKFGTAIMPIVNTYCKGCHSGSQPSGNIALTNYSQVKASVDNGKFWGSIQHLSGFVAMPYPAGSAKMPDCEITQIEKWINNGAPND